MSTLISAAQSDAIAALTNAAAAILSSLPNWAECASGIEATCHRIVRRLTALENGKKVGDWEEPISSVRGSLFTIHDRESLVGELAEVIDRYPALTGEQIGIALEDALWIAGQKHRAG